MRIWCGQPFPEGCCRALELVEEKPVHIQIGLASTEIEPQTLIQHHATDLLPLIDHFEKDGND